jgi:hypothetical protein
MLDRSDPVAPTRAAARTGGAPAAAVAGRQALE